LNSGFHRSEKAVGGVFTSFFVVDDPKRRIDHRHPVALHEARRDVLQVREPRRLLVQGLQAPWLTASGTRPSCSWTRSNF
jgi:hypothetical protein